MGKIKQVGVWPVGLVGGLMVEKPICEKNKVIGFNAAWKPDRVFPLDMAAFAINLRVILDKGDAWFSFKTLGGYQETQFLEQMVTRDQLEPLADCCTKVNPMKNVFFFFFLINFRRCLHRHTRDKK